MSLCEEASINAIMPPSLCPITPILEGSISLSNRILRKTHLPQRDRHSSLIGAVKCCCIRAIFGKGYIKSKPYFLHTRIQDSLPESWDLIVSKLAKGLKGAGGQKKCQDVF